MTNRKYVTMPQSLVIRELDAYMTECIERFWSKVDKSGGEDACWIWTGYKPKGYGRFQIHRKNVRTHRLSYALTYGEIPEGVCVLHNCPDGDNPSCCNPRHLWLGTHTDNAEDRYRKGRDAKGERNGSRLHPESKPRGEHHYRAKLSNSDVEAIRAEYSKGGVTFTELGRRFGVGRTSIADIVHRKRWTHI